MMFLTEVFLHKHLQIVDIKYCFGYRLCLVHRCLCWSHLLISAVKTLVGVTKQSRDTIKGEKRIVSKPFFILFKEVLFRALSCNYLFFLIA